MVVCWLVYWVWFARSRKVGSGLLYIYRSWDCSGLYGVVCSGGGIGGIVVFSAWYVRVARSRNSDEVLKEGIKARQWRNTGE